MQGRVPKGARAPRANVAWAPFDTAALQGRGASLSGERRRHAPHARPPSRATGTLRVPGAQHRRQR
eukprot:8679267-Lingulodinium_polyedra.AAC.1